LSETDDKSSLFAAAAAAAAPTHEASCFDTYE